MIFRVAITGLAEKQLCKLPRHIVDNLTIWVAAVEHDGLEEVRKVRGYHDEPLKGDRTGQRSIRLSRAYRAIYEVKTDTVRSTGRRSQQARVLTEAPMRKTKAKKSETMKLLEKISGGPLTLGRAIESIRTGQGLSQNECAKKIGVSKSHLCDVEKGRKTVSPERAARWARVLGYPESVLVRLAIQDGLDAAGLKYKVEIEAA